MGNSLVSLRFQAESKAVSFMGGMCFVLDWRRRLTSLSLPPVSADDSLQGAYNHVSPPRCPHGTTPKAGNIYAIDRSATKSPPRCAGCSSTGGQLYGVNDSPGYGQVMLTGSLVKYFLLSAPVDWQPDQLIRRFLLPTGDYVSCVLW